MKKVIFIRLISVTWVRICGSMIGHIQESQNRKAIQHLKKTDMNQKKAILF